MSPPDIPGHTLIDNSSESINDISSFASLEELIYYEEKNIIDLLTVTLRAAPKMLGEDGIKKSKNSGRIFLKYKKCHLNKSTQSFRIKIHYFYLKSCCIILN